VSISEAAALGITNLKAVAEGSDDRHLKFSFTTTKPIEANQTLTFIVTKKSTDPKKGNHEVKSAPFTYTVSYTVVSPNITSLKVQNNQVAIAGTNLFNTKANPLTVTLHSNVAGEKDVSTTVPDLKQATGFKSDVPSGLSPGCWSANVKWNQTPLGIPASSDQVRIDATPKITDAQRKTDSIAVKGEQLADTSACGGTKLHFRLVNSDATKTLDVTGTQVSLTEFTLALPADAKTGNWNVQVLQDATVVSSASLN
jgi:hypothetical protein